MKQILIVLLFIIAGISGVSAQGGAGQDGGGRANNQEVEILKIAYMSDKIGLTPEESAKFWPLYNQYWKEYIDINRNFRDLNKQVDEASDATGNHLSKLLTLYDLENAMRRRWAEQFKTVLSEQKVVRVFVSQESFKNYLLRRRLEEDKR
ncbi:MAG: hypothetical protein R3Y19_02130 [Rikenellaceae bacterium]